MKALIVCLIACAALSVALSPTFPATESSWYNVTVSLRKIKPSYLPYLIPHHEHTHDRQYWLGAVPPPSDEVTPMPMPVEPPTDAPNVDGVPAPNTMPDTVPPSPTPEEGEHHHHHHGKHKKIDVYSFCVSLNKLPVNSLNYQAFLTVTFADTAATTGATTNSNKFGVFVGHYHSGKLETYDLENELMLVQWGGVGLKGFNVYEDLSKLSGVLIVKHGTPEPSVKIAIQSDQLGFAPVATIMIYPPPKTHCELWNERVDAIPRMQRSRVFSMVMLGFLIFTCILSLGLIARRIHMNKRRLANARRTQSPSPRPQPTAAAAPAAPASQPAMVYALGPNAGLPAGQQMVAVPLQMIQSLYPQLLSQVRVPAPAPIPVPAPAVQHAQQESPPSYLQASNFILTPLPQAGVTLPLTVKPPVAPIN